MGDTAHPHIEMTEKISTDPDYAYGNPSYNSNPADSDDNNNNSASGSKIKVSAHTDSEKTARKVDLLSPDLSSDVPTEDDVLCEMEQIEQQQRHRKKRKRLSIFEIAQHGNTNLLLRRLSAEIDPMRRKNLVQSRDERGAGLLLHAVRHGQVHLVNVLLSTYGADIKSKDDDGCSVMHYACMGTGTENMDQREMLTLLLNNGADAVAVDKFGTTAMHTAASCGMTSAADWFISLSLSDPDTLNPNLLFKAKNSEGGTPLHEAAKKCQLGVAGVLLERAREFGDAVDAGSLLAMQDERGNTPLHAAAQHGGLGAVQLLVEKATKAIEDLPRFVNEANKKGTTALLYAVKKLDLNVVQYLVDQGARGCSYDTLGKPMETMLHIACSSGNLEIMECLLGAGAEIDLMAQDEHSATPLHRALSTKDEKVIRLLLNWSPEMLVLLPPGHGSQRRVVVRYNGNNNLAIPLGECCFHRDDIVDNIMRTVTEKSKNIEAQGKETDDYVFKCSFDDRGLSGVETLSVDDGVERCQKSVVDVADDEGNTPLHMCAAEGLMGCVQILLKCGASLDQKNEVGETPFLSAAENGHNGICDLMIEKSCGNCLGDADKDFNKAMHVAARGGHLDLIHLLIDKNMNKEDRNMFDMTPLDMAAEYSHRSVVNFLIGRNSPFDDSFDNQTLRLHIACTNGHANSVKQLLQEGVDVKKRNKFGLNPLDVAIERKHSNVAAVIIDSSQWREALMNAGGVKVRDEEEAEEEEHGTYTNLADTPTRKLIRTMPEVAALAFNKCIKIDQEKDNPTQDETGLFVEFNYEFIDDTYARFDVDPDEVVEVHDALYDESERPTRMAKPYNKKSAYVKRNHPLSIMINHGREDLLYHPLVLGLISRKFEISWPFYFSLLIFFISYLAVLTSFLVRHNPLAHMKNVTCQHNHLFNEPHPFWHETIAPILLYIYSGIGISMEIVQVILTKLVYFKNFTNLLDWLTYGTTILCVVDFSGCGMTLVCVSQALLCYIDIYTGPRTIVFYQQRICRISGNWEYRMGMGSSWQWQLGAFAVFFAWMDLILFLRRFPWVGIYVLMVYNVLGSFLRFMVVFMLFIFAFNFSFYILLQNQPNFAYPFYSIMKTWTMMLGEMDYSTTFHDQELTFEASTYVMFIIFLIIATIILNNLLTGLAVDDVSALKESARLSAMMLQIDLALEIESAMTRQLQRLLRSVLRREVYHADTKPRWWMRPMYALQPAFSKQKIRKMALQKEEVDAYHEDSLDDRMRMNAEASMSEMKKMSTHLTKIITKGLDEQKQQIKIESEEITGNINGKLSAQDTVLDEQRKEMEDLGQNLEQILFGQDKELENQRKDLIQMGNRLTDQLKFQDEQLQVQHNKVTEISESLLKRIVEQQKEGVSIASSKESIDAMFLRIYSLMTSQNKHMLAQKEELAEVYRRLATQMTLQVEQQEQQQYQLREISALITPKEGPSEGSQTVESLSRLRESLDASQRDSAARQQVIMQSNATFSDNVLRRLARHDNRIDDLHALVQNIHDMLRRLPGTDAGRW